MVTLGASKEPEKKAGYRSTKKRDEEMIFTQESVTPVEEERRTRKYDRSKKRED